MRWIETSVNPALYLGNIWLIIEIELVLNLKTICFSAGWTLILADKSLLEGEEGAWSFFPRERGFLSSFCPLVQTSVSSDWSTNNTSSFSKPLSGAYLHSFMPSSCFVCLGFAAFTQLSCSIALFYWHFLMCKSQPSGQKEPEKTCLSTRAKSKYIYPPLALYILPRFAACGLIRPIPSPRHQQGIEEGRALPYPKPKAATWDVVISGWLLSKYKLLQRNPSLHQEMGLVFSWVDNAHLKI